MCEMVLQTRTLVHAAAPTIMLLNAATKDRHSSTPAQTNTKLSEPVCKNKYKRFKQVSVEWIVSIPDTSRKNIAR